MQLFLILLVGPEKQPILFKNKNGELPRKKKHSKNR